MNYIEFPPEPATEQLTKEGGKMSFCDLRDIWSTAMHFDGIFELKLRRLFCLQHENNESWESDNQSEICKSTCDASQQ